MKVVHTVASTRSEHGGPSRSVPAICEALSEFGVEVHLVTAVPDTGGDHVPVFPSGTVQTHLISEGSPLSKTLRSPVNFYHKLGEVVDRINPDILHDHGVWLPSNGLAAWTASQCNVPLIVSPRGMLTEWALSHKAWKKALAWYGYQRWTMEQAVCFHVTAETEAEELRELGFSQPMAVIRNGVRLPESMPADLNPGEKRALFLSRLHPKKGLSMLLEAWSQVRPLGWTLELVGPSEGGHRADLERQAARLGIQETVEFSGPVNDTRKWQKYASADLFILPSHSENFGIVVAEALAAGVPVITTTGTPWEGVERHDCGWWVKPETKAIADALATATERTVKERENMGERGRRLVEDQYSWSEVAKQMYATYQWVAGEEEALPDWIQ